MLVLTLVLPDGMGDLIFGESAVRELSETGLHVAWIRCYSSEDGHDAGERLVRETAESVAFSFASRSRDGLGGALGAVRLEELWREAQERFLAPWIFGLSQQEDVLIEVAQRTRAGFFAFTEYGRSMGNIYTYTRGMGSMLPTGWVFDNVDGTAGGVFKSILRAPRTETDWRRDLAAKCGLDPSTPVRLWWFYSRKDDEKKHDFRILSEGSGDEEHVLAKVVPVGADSTPLLGHEKTSGEKLAEQLFQASADPNFKPTTDVACAEVTAGLAGQLSQYLWGVLFDPAYTADARGAGASQSEEGVVDIVVAPNVLTALRSKSKRGYAVARIPQLDLVSPSSSSRRELPLVDRTLFVVSTKVPRAEMRSFLEQCEDRVYTTGDQSLAEAILLGKVPGIKPDAKVGQWQMALTALLMGKLDDVPDLGKALRELALDKPGVRERVRRESRRRSEEVEKHIIAQLGGPPETWSPPHQVLARAGMLG